MRLETIDYKNKRASGQEVGVHNSLELLTSWSAVTVLFCLTFGIVYMALLWKDGRFDNFFEGMFGPEKIVKKPDNSWMLGSRKRVVDYGNVPNSGASQPKPSAAPAEDPSAFGPEAALTKVE